LSDQLLFAYRIVAPEGNYGARRALAGIVKDGFHGFSKLLRAGKEAAIARSGYPPQECG
jgi:hypothetical protein